MSIKSDKCHISNLLKEVVTIRSDIDEKQTQLSQQETKALITLGAGAVLVGAVFILPWIIPISASVIGHLIGEVGRAVRDPVIVNETEKIFSDSAYLRNQVVNKNIEYQNNIKEI